MDKRNDLDLLVFDLDGTLIDTTLYIVLNYTHLFDKYNVHVPSLTDMVYFSGPPLTKILPKYFPDVPLPELLEEFERFSIDHSNHYSSLYPDEIDVLRNLKAAGYKLALLTNKRRRPMVDNLKYFGIDVFFDRTLALDECPKPKPDPYGIQFLAKELDVPCERTMSIGDSIFDIEAGKRAGAKTALVTFGLKREAIEADERFDSFKALERSLIV